MYKQLIHFWPSRLSSKWMFITINPSKNSFVIHINLKYVLQLYVLIKPGHPSLRAFVQLFQLFDILRIQFKVKNINILSNPTRGGTFRYDSNPLLIYKSYENLSGSFIMFGCNSINCCIFEEIQNWSRSKMINW